MSVTSVGWLTKICQSYCVRGHSCLMNPMFNGLLSIFVQLQSVTFVILRNEANNEAHPDLRHLRFVVIIFLLALISYQ